MSHRKLTLLALMLAYLTHLALQLLGRYWLTSTKGRLNRHTAKFVTLA